MNMLYPDSLALTLDALNEAYFFQRPVSESHKEQAAEWVAGRQGKPGSYANMFAPTDDDYSGGIRLFTGERVHSKAATGHILGEEGCRALILLEVHSTGVDDALRRASLGMTSRLGTSDRLSGTYCCRTCTPALWRHLAVGGLEDGETWLSAGMSTLKSRRDGGGRWRTFPFYYTLLALSEVDLPSAVEEMRYASQVCQRYLRRSPKDDRSSQRRHALVEKVLARC
jgi:hypothetical protein